MCRTLAEGDTVHQSIVGKTQNMEIDETACKTSTHHSYQSMKGEYRTKDTGGSLGGSAGLPPNYTTSTRLSARKHAPSRHKRSQVNRRQAKSRGNPMKGQITASTK
jgi:hypothetical protein